MINEANPPEESVPHYTTGTLCEPGLFWHC